jgi:hypothetical protein
MRKIFSTIIFKNTSQRVYKWLFLGFLLTLPLSVRKILWYMPLGGVFNEYADISIYASDVFLVASFAVWIFTLKHNKRILSTIKECSTWNKKSIDWKMVIILLSPLGLILWSIFSLFYAINQFIGVFFIIKLIEWYVLYLFIIFHIVSRETILYTKTVLIIKTVCRVFIFVGVIESVLGIVQFLQQKSIGLTFISESVVHSSMPGIAKIIAYNTPYIRAYGTFPHPNILGGFLMTSILLSYFYYKVFHVEHRSVFKQQVVIGIQSVGLLLTFSKSAMLGLVVACVYFKIVSRGTNNGSQLIIDKIQHIEKKLFHVERFKINFIIGMVVVFVMSMLFFQFNMDALLFQSLRERLVYQSIAIDVIRNHPILGISCGQLVIFMSQSSIYPLLSWQLQPVHNIFLLIWAELGGVGFMIFSGWFSILLMNIFSQHKFISSQHLTQRKQSITHHVNISSSVYFNAIMIGLLPILLFDHYLWDIQQGQGLFWIISGVVSGYILQHKR